MGTSVVRTRHGAGGIWVVPVVAMLVVALRLPYTLAPEGADEGGYLVVARQWHSAGSSLYGRYWVDRPPLLITLFQVASGLGGLTAVRLLGALAAAVAVVAAAAAARRVGGRRAAIWAAVVAGALLASPLMGTVQVNGELLAAPFIAAGIFLAVVAAQSPAASGARRSAFGAGACAAAALLVKQNMAEVAVFAVVCWLVAYRNHGIDGRRLRLLVAGAVAGGLSAIVVMGVWTVAHGTSLSGVYDAIYPFRLRAVEVIAAHGGAPDAHRLRSLVAIWAVSGAPLVMLALGWALLRRWVAGPVAWGLLVTLCYSTASILASGGFWDHYLVENIVPAAIAVGVLAGARLRLAHRLGGFIVAVAAVGWGVCLVLPSSTTGVTIGSAVGRVSRTGDTLVAAFGNAETVQSSGLSSPYPYLWTLPAQTLDPRLRLLRKTLRGPNAPTWFVTWNHTSFRRQRTELLNAVVASHYRAVARVCGRTIYLRNGVSRAVPQRGIRCVGPTVLTRTVRQLTRGGEGAGR